MRRTWLYSPARLSRYLVFFALSTALILGTWGYPAFASRGGVEETSNEFTVGFTFKFGNIEQLCSGALISPTVIATARHCAYSNSGEYGSEYIFSPPGTPLDAAINPNLIPPKVKRFILDPNFKTDLTLKINDIAFIELDKPIATKGFIKIGSRTDLETIDTSTVYGYGYGAVFELGTAYSVYPRRYELNWQKWDSRTAQSNTFSLPSPSNSACRGDSGGPIATKLTNGQYLLIGLLSGAADVVENCGTKNSDGDYYMRLTAAFPFLALIADIYPPKASPSPTPLKKKTISCVKGKVTKKVTAINPKCPKGYKKKSI